jgi:hypothetical protein
MKGVDGKFSSDWRSSEGTGQVDGLLRIQDRYRYRMDYVVHKAQPFSCSVAADGKRKFVRSGEQVLTPVLASQQSKYAKLPIEMYADTFFDDYSRMMFQGLTDGVDAWTPMIASFKQNGFTLKLEERRLSHMGREYLNYKLTGFRAKDPRKLKSNQRFEVVLDGTFWLPVTVTTSWKDAKGKPWDSQWSAGFAFGRKFKPEDLTLSSGS